MAITQNSDRQTVLTALVDVDYTMLTDGVAGGCSECYQLIRES